MTSYLSCWIVQFYYILRHAALAMAWLVKVFCLKRLWQARDIKFLKLYRTQVAFKAHLLCTKIMYHALANENIFSYDEIYCFHCLLHSSLNSINKHQCHCYCATSILAIKNSEIKFTVTERTGNKHWVIIVDHDGHERGDGEEWQSR